jgi:hypothetical protein
MTENEILAYIAGIMDGDGSFSICRKKDKKAFNLLHFPFIQFGSLEKNTLEFLKNHWKGSIITQKSHVNKNGKVKKEFFHWRLEKSGRCQPFLESVIPYLEIKKERAEFLLDYIKRNPFKRGSNRLDPGVVASRERDYLKMQEFNDEKTFSINVVRARKTYSEDVVFWAYFAGLLDTDGSFSIKKEKTSRYSPQILLTQTDVRGINKIRKNCPFGAVCFVTAKSTQMGGCYRFGIYSVAEIKILIPKLLPYLRRKNLQALELLKFCNEKQNVSHRQAGVPEEELKFREECYQNVCNLNKYGVYKPSLIDLEAREGDRAQGESQRERLSEMGSKEHAIV